MDIATAQDMHHNETYGDDQLYMNELIDELLDIYSSLDTLFLDKGTISNKDMVEIYIEPLMASLNMLATNTNIYTLIVVVARNQNLINLSENSKFVRALNQAVKEVTDTNDILPNTRDKLIIAINKIIDILSRIKRDVQQGNPNTIVPIDKFDIFPRIQSALSIDIDAVEKYFERENEGLAQSFKGLIDSIESVDNDTNQLRPFFINILPDIQTIDVTLTVAHAATFETREIKHDFGKDRGDIKAILPLLLQIIQNCIWHDINQVYNPDLADSVKAFLEKNVDEEQTSICISEIMKTMSICRIGTTASHGDASISTDIPDAEDVSIGYPPNFLNILPRGSRRIKYISDAYGTLPPLLGPFKHNFEEIQIWGWLRKYDAANPMYITTQEDREIRARELLAYNQAMKRLSTYEQPSSLGNINTLRFFNFASQEIPIISVTNVADGFSIEFPFVNEAFRQMRVTLDTSFHNILNFSVSTVSSLLLDGIQRCKELYGKKNSDWKFLEWVQKCTYNYDAKNEKGKEYLGYLFGYYLRCILLTKGFGDSVIFTSIGMGSAANDLIKDAAGISTLPIVQSMQVTTNAPLVDKQKENIAKLLANGDLQMDTTIVLSGDYISSGWGISQYSIKKQLGLSHGQPSEFSNFLSVIGGFHGPRSDNLIPISSLSELSLQLMYATKFHETNRVYMHIISEMKELCFVPLDGFPLAKCFCESNAASNLQNKLALAYFNYKPKYGDQEKLKKIATQAATKISNNPLEALQKMPNVLDHVGDGVITLNEDTIFYLQKFSRCSNIVYNLNKVINDMSREELIEFVDIIKGLEIDSYPVVISNDEMPLFHVANYVALNIQIRMTNVDEVPNFLKIPNTDTDIAMQTLVQKQPINVPDIVVRENNLTFLAPPTINAPQQGFIPLPAMASPSNAVGNQSPIAVSNTQFPPIGKGSVASSSEPSRRNRKAFRGGGKKKTSIKKNKRNKVRASRKQEKAIKVVTKSKTVKHRKHKG